jgi:hypothetical protein
VGRFLVLLAYVLAVPAGFASLMILSLWLSDSTHEFGPWDPRYLLLVHGTEIERLGLIQPLDGSVRYSATGLDGNSPAHVFVSYSSRVSPEQLIEAYSMRCGAIGLTAHKSLRTDDDQTLLCDGKGGEIGIRTIRSKELTHVTMGGWLTMEVE